ncbi:SDR family NAD(P)-dependent oxidoreductase [Cellulomonas fimi]|uniref:SDR family NAD(P)-dependent oxidoreductase n=1 Tax=Cellulomonas fimi TaxID=1708 RepID=UPI000F82A442
MTGRLAGKVALITGTAGGQGRAAARLFAAKGACVVACDVDATGAQQTGELVRGDGGDMHSSHPLDLADEDRVRAWIDDAASRHGGIDTVYNNAAATRFSPIGDTSYEDWSFVVRHELDIVFLVTRHGWRHLVFRGGGSVQLVVLDSRHHGVAHEPTAGTHGHERRRRRDDEADRRGGRTSRHPGELHQPWPHQDAGERGHAPGCRPSHGRHRVGDPARASGRAGGRREMRALLGLGRVFIRHGRQPGRRRRLVRRLACLARLHSDV